MSTKAQTINNAYTQLRISGLTVNPTPANLQLGLYLLETMMAEFYENQALNVGYKFEQTPDLNSLTGVSLGNQNMMDFNLAVRLIPSINKDVPPELKSQADVSFSRSLGMSVQNNMRMIQPPRRMPVGSGVTFRGVFWNRFSLPVPVPPVEAATNYILQGEQFNYTEDFSVFLGTATIASWEIASNPLLTIVDASQSGSIISYTILAPTSPPATYGPFQQVKITITDSLGRVEIRLINFGVSTPPVVPDVFAP